MDFVRLFVDMTAARRLARHVEMRFPDVTRSEKWAVVEDVRTRHPKLAEGLRRVWHLE